MRRTLRASLPLIAAAALLLSGCAAAQHTTSDTAPGGSQAPTGSAQLEGTLSIAAAASLQPAFEELSTRFQTMHPGVKVENLTFDGSSTLAEQILSGASFDVFASADEKNMNKVVDGGLIDGDPAAFATSSLEIAVAPGNPLGIRTLADLAKAGTVTVICAPEVPCGAAARTLLERDGVKLHPASEEQNVTAVLTKVSAGEADAGLIYRSDVLRSEGKVEGIAIPGSAEAAGRYMIAPLTGAKSPEAARAFAEFVRSDESQALLKKLGFGPA